MNIATFLLQRSDWLGDWLLHRGGWLSLELLLFALLIFGILKAARPQSARTRQWLWALALIKPLIALFIAWPFGLTAEQPSGEPTADTTGPAIPAMSANPQRWVPDEAHPEEAESLAPVQVADAALQRAQLAGAPAPQKRETLSISGHGVLAGLWLSGVAALGVYTLIGGMWLGHLRRRSLPLESPLCEKALHNRLSQFPSPLPVEVRVSDRIPCPLAFGFRRGIVLLPRWCVERLRPAALELLLLHELSHLRFFDHWLLWYKRLIETLFWFHPAVWYAGRQMVREAEQACDDAVVALSSQPREYASCLMQVLEQVAQTKPRRGLTGLALGASPAGQRIRRLLADEMVSRRVTKRGFIAMLFIGVISLPSFLGVKAASENQAANPQPRPVSASDQKADLEPQALATEVAKILNDGELTTDWPLTQALMHLPEPMRRQLGLSDEALTEAASLTRDTGEERKRIRRQVAQVLGLREDRTTIDSLTANLKASDEQQRRYAAFGLWLVGDGTAIASLNEAAHDTDMTARLFAILALGRILEFKWDKNEATVKALVEGLRDDSEVIRREAARALAHMKQSAENAVPTLIALVKADASAYVRQQAAHGIGHLGESSQEATEALIAALQDESEHVRRYAANGLAGMQKSTQAAITALSALLKADASEEVRREAAHALGHLGASSQEAASALIEALQDKSARVRGEAAFGLSNIETLGKPAIPILIRLLKTEPSEIVRKEAAHALGHLGSSSQEAVEALRETLKNDSSEEVRREAASALEDLEEHGD